MYEKIFTAVIQAAAILYVVVRIFKAVWSRVRDKEGESEQSMRVIVQAEKRRHENREEEYVDKE